MSPPTPLARRRSLRIVGIGASAGGLEAFSQLLRALPAETGLGFVLVQHLAATHESALAEILSRETAMPVIEVGGEQAVEANVVYVIPPGQGLVITDGVLSLVPRQEGLHHPIDQFFRSLAEDQRDQAVGIILSGTATDGTVGLEAIKGEGGLTFAQDDSARYDGMPHSAISAGVVDFILSPEGIAGELVRIADGPGAEEIHAAARDDSGIARIVSLLHEATGLDFSHYKFNTLYRRINRRMLLQQMHSTAEYLRFLQQTPGEAEGLRKDLLISVTSFFRDPAAFEALRSTVFPALLRDRTAREPVRAWCVGCSTGQEAYSVAIAYSEYCGPIECRRPLQLFATDVNGSSIHTARAGIYGKEIAETVSPVRLERYFTEVDGRYRIAREIRDSCIFSQHNVAADPPFSRIDLLTCRNLLIYMEPALQEKVVPLFHYALRPGGFLWLGGSETTGVNWPLFDPVDPKNRIYTRNGSSPGAQAQTSARPGRAPFIPIAFVPERVADLPKDADRILANKFGPPAVVVTRELDIIQFRGDTEPYLAPSPGKATLNLMKLLREELVPGVRSAVLKATTTKSAAREANLRVRAGTGYRALAVEVIPLAGPAAHEAGFLVVFEPAPTPGVPDEGDETVPAPVPPADQHTARLEQELVSTRAHMHSVIEQQEAANEELQSANEEIQSANEELQSINEELETSKEEIESSNEELVTVNDELNRRNAELGRLNDDLANLMASTQMPIIMVGSDLRIRRFTGSAERLLNLIRTDIGRPIGDITLNLEDAPDLEALLKEVLETMTVREQEVRDKRGRWYSLRLRPYRTLDQRIDGVVMMLVDINDLKLAMARTAGIVATVREPLLVLDEELRVLSASSSFYANFQVEPDNTVGRLVFELGNGQWDIPALRTALLEVLPTNQEFSDFEVEHDFEQLGRRDMILNARRMQQTALGAPAILLAIEDRTDQRTWERRLRATEAAARQHHQQLRAIYDMAPLGLCLIDRDLRFVMVNNTLAAMNGLPAADHIGRAVRDVVPALADSLEPAFQRVMEAGIPMAGVIIHGETPAAPGVRRTYLASYYPLRDEEGVIRGVNVIAQDMTDRDRMEESVRMSELRYRRLFEAAKDGILILDADTARITDANPCVCLMLGYSRDEVIGKEPWQVGVFPNAAASRAAMLALQELEQTRHDELTINSRQGRQVIVEMISSVYREDVRRVIRCNLRDVTVQHAADRALQRSADELREADRRKDEFLAMLAHELRNPLAPIRNALEVMRLATGHEPSASGATEMMERQVGQMVRLVDDLLDVSRISRGAIELRKVRVDLAEVIRQALEAAHPLCAERGQQLLSELPEERIQLYADPARLAQIVGNLLHNSCKYTSRGGQVAIMLSREADTAVIRVRDNGIGMSANELLHAFDLFMQADTSLTRSGSGLGIGLTLVKRLTEQHGGTVQATSAGPGMGSEFTVRLPVDQRTRAEPPAAAPVDALHQRPHRVLIVDDNHDSADSLAILLQLSGHTTRTAYDGELALGIAEEFEAEVILLDLGLPTLSGYEVARLIRSRPWGNGVRLVALTGWGQKEAREKSLAAGFDAHLVKPVDFKELLGVLDGKRDR